MAVVAVAAYAFVVIGRVSDELPSVHLAPVIGVLAIGLMLRTRWRGLALGDFRVPSSAGFARLPSSRFPALAGGEPGLCHGQLFEGHLLFGATVYLVRSREK